jgi:hypothetical protein
MFLKHQRKIKIKMRRSLQRCHTDTRKEKGSKSKKTFAKTKKECGSWLLDNTDEFREEKYSGGA